MPGLSGGGIYGNYNRLRVCLHCHYGVCGTVSGAEKDCAYRRRYRRYRLVFIYLRHELGYTSFVSNFCATISLALASELSSRIFKQPVTVFVIPGIVPLVPGLGIYQGMFAIINNEYNNGTSILLTAMTDSVAIAIGVMLVSSLFRVLKVRRFMLQYRRSKRQMELKVKGRK